MQQSNLLLHSTTAPQSTEFIRAAANDTINDQSTNQVINKKQWLLFIFPI